MSISIVADAPDVPGISRVLTPEALEFLSALHGKFGDRRTELLALRKTRRQAVADGARLDFLPETAAVREGDWKVASVPAYLADRRVEITGPTDRKMTINAMNSGAKVWLADMEDANTPHWGNVIDGQLNLADAIRGTITLEQGGKSYALSDGDHAVIVMRPRGWHLPEKHLDLDGQPLSGSLVDFGLYFFHNAAELLARGLGPAFYLPKMESHLEARLWAEVFAFSEEYVGVPAGSVRATVLIETIWAAFEMEEILYELRDFASGLNAGRWDYLFSVIKTFRDAGPEFVLPDRNSITMAAPFMKAYSDLLVSTCHERGAYAIGGMAAFIPAKDPAVNEVAFAKVRADKTREADAGYEGSWVAHPGLVPVCMEIFDAKLGRSVNQLSVGTGASVSADQLLDIASLQVDGRPLVTEAGLESNISVALEYLVTWMSGRGAVAIHSLMEDAATAEISRSQVWQWRQAKTTLDTGRVVTAALITDIADRATESLADVWAEVPQGRNLLADARNLLVDFTTQQTYEDFLTIRAYELIPYVLALSPQLLAGWEDLLTPDDIAYAAAYPGPAGPGCVHTVYIPVPRFVDGVVDQWGGLARQVVQSYPDQWQDVLAELAGPDAAELGTLTMAKLGTEPIEDLRIDFEDGFRAHRGTAADDDEEDGHARRAAALVAGAPMPRSWGLRIRSLGGATRTRGLRTLDLFLGELLRLGPLPDGFVVTLPKVTSLAQIEVFCAVLASLETTHALATGSLRFEIQVETPQTVLGTDGTVPVARMIHAAGGRVSGLHFGTYDYTASLGILGAHQNLRHPVADFAKGLMMLAAAETGVRVSDGSDNKVPVGTAETVGRRWHSHAEGVTRALRQGIFQGWDLHPAQLPTRFAATFAFFRDGWSEAAVRLGDYHRQVPGAGGVLDEPATAFALARHLAAALACGAVQASELEAVADIDAAVVERYLVRGAPPGVSG